MTAKVMKFSLGHFFIFTNTQPLHKAAPMQLEEIYQLLFYVCPPQPLGNPSTPSKSRSNYLHPINLMYCIECSPCLEWRNQTQIGWLLCRSLLSFLEGRLWASVFDEKSSTCNVDVVFSISSNADWPVHHYSIFYYFKFPATQVLDLTRSALIFFFSFTVLIFLLFTPLPHTQAFTFFSQLTLSPLALFNILELHLFTDIPLFILPLHPLANISMSNFWTFLLLIVNLKH